MAHAMNLLNFKPQQLLRSITSLVIFLVLFSGVALVHGDNTDSKSKAKSKSELIWKNGDRLPGKAVGFSDNKLTFESPLFREPLEIDIQWLSSFKTNAKAASDVDSEERFSIQLIDGQTFLADIQSLDENVLKANSKRSGKFEIDRKSIASIYNRKISQTIISGSLDLDRWESKQGGKRLWKSNQDGEVVATSDDIHLYLESELPDSCLIDIEIGWDEKLDFAMALGVPRSPGKIDKVPRLETWEGAVVFSHDDDFEVVLEELDEDAKLLKLLIHWDKKSNNIVIHDEQGVELASAKLKTGGKFSKQGIFLQNKSGDITIKSIGIRSASAGFNPSITSIALKSDDAINAEVKSFDGSTWKAIADDKEIEISPAEFVGAAKFNPDAKFKRLVGDTLRFHDGEKVIGTVVAVKKDSVTVKTSALTEPIEFNSKGLKELQFNPKTGLKQAENFNHVLTSGAGKISGRLESGEPTDDNVLFWRVAGAVRAVPFANAFLGKDDVNAKVVLKQDNRKEQFKTKWPDTLFLNNRDLLPIRFVSANENEITVDSFFENRVIPGSKIRAVEFDSQGSSLEDGFSNPGWQKNNKAKVNKQKLKLKKGATVGHPNLMGSGGFEFELNWPQSSYGNLKVQFGDSQDKKGVLRNAERSQSFGIMLYAQHYSVNEASDGQNPGQNLKTRGGKSVRFKVAVEKNRLVVFANGKKCFDKKLRSGFGRCVCFRLDDLFQQNITCELSKLKLSEGYLSGDFIDSERKELILTIPRLKARNPPGQIICATNYDLARGNIVSIDDEHVKFRTDNSVNRFSREILSSVVWIDSEGLVKSLASEENDPGKDEVEKTEVKRKADQPKEKEPEAVSKNQIVQVLMHGGRRVTLMLKRWDDNKLIGQSGLLGKCEIPFDQIYEIRMGKYATDAVDVPWSDWTAKLAPKPKLEGGTGPGQSSSAIFGSESPLIGKSPKVTFAMLGGEKTKLESLKGKVVVLDFWATWCGPCVKSLPDIKKVIDTYPDSAVSLITVNQNESKEKIKAFLKSRKIDLTVALDKGDIAEKFNVEAIPQTVIIDSEGKIQFVKTGISNDMHEKLKDAIDSLLNAEPESPGN